MKSAEVSGALDQDHRLGSKALAPAREPQFLGGSGLYVKGVGGKAEQRGHVVPHPVPVGSDLGSFSDETDIRIHHLPAPFGKITNDLFQQPGRIRALVGGIGIREVLADVTESCGAQQGVHEGMEHHVGVAVTCKTAVMRDLTAHENEGAVIFGCGEPVDVEPLSDPDRGHRSTWWLPVDSSEILMVPVMGCSGNVMMTSVPLPSWLMNSRVPPCSSTIFFTVAMPSPVPIFFP